MPAGKFISQLGTSRLPYEHLDQSLVVICVRYHDFVDISWDGRLVRHRRVFIRHPRGLPCKGVVVGIRRDLFVDVHVARINPFSHARKAIGLDDIVLLGNLSVFCGSICKAIESVYAGVMYQHLGTAGGVK